MPSRRSILRSVATITPLAALAYGSPRMRAAIESLQAVPVNASASDLATNEDYWRTVQEAFDMDRTITNLNNGGVSPSPRSVQGALRRYTEQANQAPAYEMWSHQEGGVEVVRKGIAGLFGCDSEEIAITRNASESLEAVQLGLPLQKGDEVITTTQDYPRMLTTWEQRVRRDGIVLKKVKVPVPLTDPRDFVRAIEAAITDKTKVIHISHVVFLTGQINPVADVCKLARSRNIWCIVDGAHAFAHFPFTRDELACDFYGTSLHKWTCGPIGTGFLYVRKERIKDVWPLMAAPKEMDENIRKFEEIGTHPAAVHNALAEAVAFNAAMGLERKAARLRYLHSILRNELDGDDRFHWLTDISSESNQCGLRCLHINGIEPGKVQETLLTKHRIFTVAIVHDEFNGLRLAPSVYTTVAEMERAGKALRAT